MRNIIFLTFADKRGIPMLKRIKREVLEMNFFTSVKICSDNNLRRQYKKQNKQRFKLRGYGYWIWKSYLVKETLTKMNSNDILVYADAGCTINKNGIQRLKDYLHIVDKTHCGILTFQHDSAPHLEKEYTKGDLFAFTNTNSQSSIYNTPQLWAGSFIIRKCELSSSFVEEWYDLCHNHFDLITDQPSRTPNFPCFIEHRHDQSAFSVLLKPYFPAIISDKETYTTGNFNEDLQSFPIWATRKREYINKECFLKRIIRKIINLCLVK
jgi:hypothetical protein